jgi:vancomycin resistance protein YoaR
MTTTTETQITGATVDADEGRRWRLSRVLVAFVIGVLLVVVAAVGTILAYEQNYTGKVAAGVSIGGVEVAGLTRDEAAAKLGASFASVGTGTVTLQAPTGSTTLTYAQLGRHPDVDAMLDEALAIGRTGNPLERVVEEARTVLGRVDVAPRVAIDRAVLDTSLVALAAKVESQPSSAVVTSGPAGFVDTPAVWGRDVDEAAMVATITQALNPPDAPAALTIPLAVVRVAPAVTDVDAVIARVRADRMIAPIVLTHGKDHWTISAETVRSWISFGTWPDGSYGPLLDPAGIEAAVKSLSKKVDQKAVSASFYTGKSGGIVGVKPATVGRTLDVPGTVSAVQNLLITRAGVVTPPSGEIVPALAIVQPQLTTEQATKAAPLMRAISSWTTYYQSGPHNGFSANITIPSMAINGTVVAPGEWFSYWKTVGEVSVAKGYKLGGAIIDGHSVEGKSIGGGICSSSTTLFNAAVRAGLQMGARKNHYYYITRYPKGLDATVFISDGGTVQDMTFRNDTKYPILIRTYAKPGIVRFTLYSVPTGRRVSFVNRVSRNYRPSHTEVRYVTSLRPGARVQVEYAADGFDYWVTRIVRDKSGKVIHSDRYYSHYARMTGLILIGKAK